MITICKAKKIDTNEYVEGFIITDRRGNYYITDNSCDVITEKSYTKTEKRLSMVCNMIDISTLIEKVK